MCRALLAACLPLVAVAAEETPIVTVTDEEPTLEEIRRAAATRVKAAYMRNFLRYVEWPKTAFADAKAPFVICVLGDDPLVEVLESKLDEWTFKRPFKVSRLATAAAVKTGGCHIAYIGESERSNQEMILCLLHGRPTLTVSEARNFWDVDGSIRLRLRLQDVDFETDRVVSDFDVNLDATRFAGLKINSKMLDLARNILQNGVERPKD